MIYLYQNEREYDYDVRATALAFFEREKIVEKSEAEWEELLAQKEETEKTFLRLIFQGQSLSGIITDGRGKKAENEISCRWQEHGESRNEVCRFLYRLFSSYTGKILPWGTLTGIRPTKIIMKWMEEEKEAEEAALEKRFSETYLADGQKARLCVQVAQREKRFLDAWDYEKEYSLYVGIPFCPTTCLYCSFASYPVSRFADRMQEYMSALIKEMEYVAKACAHKRLTSIYVGGGTPTALDADSLALLMDEIHRLFPVEEARELTVEAGRPDSITRKKLEILRRAGVGRISINPQTMHQGTLDLIGRNHTVQQLRDSYALAREIGFSNINMDIITGLPGEELPHVKETLKQIFSMKPDSLTVHSLAIKRAANLNIEMEKYKAMVKGSTNEMLRAVDEHCRQAGMLPYYMYRQKNIPGNLENIGYSLPGKECLYNILIMEEKQDIIACGAGASTKFVFPEEHRIERTENVKSIEHYISRIDEMIDRKRQYLTERQK
ncbi:MAG: coproporphyrinogen dehydrogenase HemZ [Eubacteriales bacterium]|nr:coproporphyrinogen dehydrogenase HemZ [Eubacteriales bacterium]